MKQETKTFITAIGEEHGPLIKAPSLEHAIEMLTEYNEATGKKWKIIGEQKFIPLS